MPRREALSVAGLEAVGPYTLLRVERGGLEPGVPGPVLHARGARAAAAAADEPLPGAARRARVPDRPDRARHAGALRARAGDEIPVFGPLGNGFRLDVERPLLVGGGIGVAPLPYLSEPLGGPPAMLGFRSDWHAEAAALVPNAEVVVEPTYVTEAMPAGHDVLACGPEPMLEAVRALAPDAQLAWEAPMACGYGACYGCAVEIDGVLKRLCVDGPVLEAARDPQRLRLPRRARRARRSREPRRLRHEDGHAAAARGEPRRSGSPRPRPGC